MSQKVSVAQLTNYMAHQLEKRYADPVLCDQYTWWTLETITKQDEAHLIAQENIMLTPEQQKKIDHWLDQMINHNMPIQYLIGSVPFDGVDILVKSPVLIPRPETEEWTMHLIEQLKKLDNKKLSIIELCTGSGCIAVALAHALPQATIYATDIFSDAIALTKKNASHNEVTNIHTIESDLFDMIPKTTKVDLIAVNPPYIALEDWQKLDLSVTQWEDKKALVAPHHGLAIIERIIFQAPTFLKQNDEMAQKKIPQLVIEIDYTQAAGVRTLAEQAGFHQIQVWKDLEGKDRVVTGSISHVATTQ
jgi:release factor glutamine methyltransferase